MNRPVTLPSRRNNKNVSILFGNMCSNERNLGSELPNRNNNLFLLTCSAPTKKGSYSRKFHRLNRSQNISRWNDFISGKRYQNRTKFSVNLMKNICKIKITFYVFFVCIKCVNINVLSVRPSHINISDTT
jgi:hypothetical protein